MKYIDTAVLDAQLTNGWSERARNALEAIRTATPPERAAAIQRHASLWSEWKAALSCLSQDKCWYCETKEDRSDYVIDHFRPKGGVAEAPTHGGYWWLALDYRNFRLSCTYCNSRRRDRGSDAVRGKHDHFPIAAEGQRCFDETDDLAREQPLLLDPTNQVDPTLLWFEPDGRAVPRYDESRSTTFNKRAATSIKLFHLNELNVTQRRRELHGRLRNTITDADTQFRAAIKDVQIAQKALETAFRAIRTAIDPGTAHSSAARAMLLAFTPQYPWLDTILTT